MQPEILIKKTVKENTGNTVLTVSSAGNGASGCVYRVLCREEPYSMAIKISTHCELLKKEFDMLSFLSDKTDSKLPKLYFFSLTEDKSTALLAMEFVEGISANSPNLRFKLHKHRLANSIVDNLIDIQKAHNDKFGPFDNAVYDTWQEYYKEFTHSIYTFCTEMFAQKKLESKVMRAVELSYSNFDKIFCDEIKPATLIHGDYWMPNFIINPKTMELSAAVDPFNVMWADPEYELFAMTVGFGKKLHLYEIYKNKVKVSRFCDMKLEMYALYSELLWYKKLGSISHSYLLFRSKRLINQMKKHGIVQ